EAPFRRCDERSLARAAPVEQQLPLEDRSECCGGDSQKRWRAITLISLCVGDDSSDGLVEADDRSGSERADPDQLEAAPAHCRPGLAARPPTDFGGPELKDTLRPSGDRPPPERDTPKEAKVEKHSELDACGG